jgi:rhodanese-related sulfurtransferase
MRLRPALLLASAAVVTLGVLVLVLRREPVGWRAVQAAIRLRYPDVPTITADELYYAEDHGARSVPVDVRTAGEFAVSHLPGARRVEPDAPATALADVPRDAFVIVYCSVGWRSAAFAERLRAAGYTQVHNLEGGIFRWANEGWTVMRDTQQVHRVHPYDARWGRLLARELHAYRPAP